MDCPVCKKPMIILEYEGVELDFCPTCQGCWLDRVEIGLIVNGRMDPPMELKLDVDGKSKRRCPRCNRKMRVGHLPGTDVEVDACTKQDGVWLDQGELETIVRELGEKARAASVARFVADVFGAKDKTHT